VPQFSTKYFVRKNAATDRFALMPYRRSGTNPRQRCGRDFRRLLEATFPGEF